MRTCRFCAEQIQDAAIACKHCGRDLFPRRAVPTLAPAVAAVSVLSSKRRLLNQIGGAALLLMIAVAWFVLPSQSAAPRVVRPTGVTMAQFAQLRDGSIYGEAIQILGREGTEQSRASLGGTVTVMYAWSGAGSTGANMNAMFQDDHLVTKAQFGLE